MVNYERYLTRLTSEWIESKSYFVLKNNYIYPITNTLFLKEGVTSQGATTGKMFAADNGSPIEGSSPSPPVEKSNDFIFANDVKVSTNNVEIVADYYKTDIGKGEFVDIITANKGEYPEDGAYGDYWYVLINPFPALKLKQNDNILPIGGGITKMITESCTISPMYITKIKQEWLGRSSRGGKCG